MRRWRRALAMTPCSVKSVEYHAAFISPMVASIPPSIGIKYSAMNIQRILLQSSVVNEQIVVPPSCRAVYVFLRQRYSTKQYHLNKLPEELIQLWTKATPCKPLYMTAKVNEAIRRSQGPTWSIKLKCTHRICSEH
eukprot:COSAG01_NODE_309_length_19142_cov_22.748149_21_plen_136_part_00